MNILANTLTSTLKASPSDPLLGLNAQFNREGNPRKINLGVGVYQDTHGQASVLNSVKDAETILLSTESSKSYIDPKGDPDFIQAVESLLLGAKHSALVSDRVRTVQTPGGSCALRIAADLITRCNPQATIWLSNPTWVNHEPLLGRVGLRIRHYRYYDTQNHCLDFDGMLNSLQQASPGDVVLLHGCCHNPCGEDLSLAQWQAIADLAMNKGFIPLVDIAYQGLGNHLDADAAGLRLLADNLPELLITASYSKNFAIYRERLGSLSIISNTPGMADITQSQMLDVIRGYYFVPPTHGSGIVKNILSRPTLKQSWEQELGQMRKRIKACRQLFTSAFFDSEYSSHFNHIGKQHGMFSFLGLTEGQVNTLRDKYGIYMASSSRINLSGINTGNIEYLSRSIATIM